MQKDVETVQIPKKRGRKPKGGKIVVNKPNIANNFLTNKPNIILHLKCKLTDLENNSLLTELTYEPKLHDIEGFDDKEEIFNNNYNENKFSKGYINYYSINTPYIIYLFNKL